VINVLNFAMAMLRNATFEIRSKPQFEWILRCHPVDRAPPRVNTMRDAIGTFFQTED